MSARPRGEMRACTSIRRREHHQLLVDDARRSFAEIGGRVGLTASAVKRRVDRLRADGAITGFTVRLDPGRWAGPSRATSSCTAGRAPRPRPSARPCALPRGGRGEHGLGRGRRVLRILAADMQHFERVLEQIGAERVRGAHEVGAGAVGAAAAPGDPAAPSHARPDRHVSRGRGRLVVSIARATIRVNGSICATTTANRQRRDCSCVAPLPTVEASGPRRRGRPFDPSEERPMTAVVPDPVSVGARTPVRTATPRHYLMCPPTHFAVDYAINPWMQPGDRRRPATAPSRSGTRCAAPTSTSATASTCSTPLPGLPDMVYAANGATVVDGTVLAARFRHPQRAAEAAAHADVVPRAPACARGRAGVRQRGRGRPARRRRRDPRRSRLPHRPARPRRGRPGVRPRGRVAGARRPALLPPRHRARRARRHDDRLAARGVLARPRGRVLPGALPGRAWSPTRPTPPSSDSTRCPTAGTSCCPSGPTRLAAALAERGFVPVPVDLSELLKGGGGPKCCTLEVRS